MFQHQSTSAESIRVGGLIQSVPAVLNLASRSFSPFLPRPKPWPSISKQGSVQTLPFFLATKCYEAFFWASGRNGQGKNKLHTYTYSNISDTCIYVPIRGIRSSTKEFHLCRP